MYPPEPYSASTLSITPDPVSECFEIPPSTCQSVELSLTAVSADVAQSHRDGLFAHSYSSQDIHLPSDSRPYTIQSAFSHGVRSNTPYSSPQSSGPTVAAPSSPSVPSPPSKSCRSPNQNTPETNEATTGSKRPRANTKSDVHQEHQDDAHDEPEAKRIHIDAASTPLRLRQTSQSLTASRRELAKPFRSPLITAKAKQNSNTTTTSSSPLSTSRTSTKATSPESSRLSSAASKSPIHKSPLMSVKHNNSASKPFKSPLPKSSGSVGSSSAASDRRQVQLLEKKLMTLKQAQKYRLDGSTKHLEELASKWKLAAREAAQDLWNLAQTGNMGGGDKDSGAHNDHDDGGYRSWGYGDDDVLSELKSGSKAPASSSWGWGDGDESGTTAVDEDTGNWEPPSPATFSSQLVGRSRKSLGGSEFKSVLPDDYVSQLKGSGRRTQMTHGDGEDDEPEEAEEEQDNIGSMLVSLGIPKETLGWQDAEEDFID